jgi:cytochrome b
MRNRVRVWDLPTRLFHWLLFLCVCAAALTANLGGNAMPWHLRLGEAVLALLMFRLVWGLIGGRWSRFASFVFSPRVLWRYLRGGGESVGHSPLGALAVWAMLGWLALQVATGLIADDQIATTGPLASKVSQALSERASGWHAGPGQWGLYALVALHVLAIAVYARRQCDLLTPMISGDKDLPEDVPASRDSWGTRLVALAVFALCAGFAYSLG